MPYCALGCTSFPLERQIPEILQRSNTYFLFTFLRDPLEVKISLYYFEIKMNRQLCNSLEERIFAEDNYIADRFPCNQSNYKEILDRYDFVGFVESIEESAMALAKILGKKITNIPHVNRAERDQQASLSQDIIEEFKRRNELDYKIYNYCKNKFVG